MKTQASEALTRFLQLVEIVHGPPTVQFIATQKDAERMIRSLRGAGSEEEINQDIVADQKGAWSLFQVCIMWSGQSAETLKTAPVVKLDKDNRRRAMPHLMAAVRLLQFS